jgi:hypothetical protein
MLGRCGVRGAPLLRGEVSVHGGRSREGRIPTPFHSHRIAHRGACGKTRVAPQNRRPRPEPREMGVEKCVCCCRRTTRAALRTALTPQTRTGANRRGRHDPHRRRDGGRDAAARRGQPRMAAALRVNHAGSSSQEKVPAVGPHRQPGTLEGTGLPDGVPRRQPDVVLTGEQRHRLARSFWEEFPDRS